MTIVKVIKRIILKMNKKDFNISSAFDELADLKEFEPDLLYSEDKNLKDLYGFIIGLAAFFNDISTLRQFHSYLKTIEPNDPKISKQSGAYNGIRIFLEKSIISLMYEFLSFIKNNSELYSMTSFKVNVLDRLNDEGRSIFNELVHIATDNKIQNKYFKNLMLIRNKVTSHYDSKVLLKGFKYIFSKRNKEMKCYYSIDSSDFRTRFYFADAAIQGFIDEITGFIDDQSFYKESTEELKKISYIISKIIEIFLSHKEK